MKATLEMINEMQADGVIGKYAIGGAVGATFYLEPAATLDVDIFSSASQRCRQLCRHRRSHLRLSDITGLPN